LRNSGIFRGFYAVLAVVAYMLIATQDARAIPIFAQRYHLSCTACHTVLPELNAFGTRFRDRGYQLDAPRHGTTIVAMRYQLEYEADPGASRRFAPGGVVLANADIGRISAFIHYNLGAGGGPAGLFLGYLATYNYTTHTLYRAGLFELPLAQSPGQRLDDLASYGYYATHVGLNDLSLASPRWGAQLERTIGSARVDATVALGEFKGSAYGGKPVATGETTSAAAPEVGLFIQSPVAPGISVGAQALLGSRRIVSTGRAAFDDSYRRTGLLLRARRNRLAFQAEQWWGHDANADGFGSAVGSSGGYIRLKYYPTPHAYLAIRYDAAANPSVLRDIVYYAATNVTPHVRLLLQDVQAINGTSHFGGALTVGFPWPAKL